MDEITYPTRCRIVDAGGFQLSDVLAARTPEVSVPHIGKEGWAAMEFDGPLDNTGQVVITLDDGTVLFGYECWWVPLDPTPEQHGAGNG